MILCLFSRNSKEGTTTEYEDITILPLLEKYDRPLKRYLCSNMQVCESYVETKTFCALKVKIYDEGLTKPILLQGPAGCGKSTLLFAIFNKLTEDHKKVRYTSLKTLQLITSCPRVVEDYTKHFVHRFPDDAEVKTAKDSLLQTVNCKRVAKYVADLKAFNLKIEIKHKLYILIDFNTLKDTTIKQFSFLMNFIEVFTDIKMILAVSSGAGVDLECQITRGILGLQRLCAKVDVVGFSENEARQFAKHCGKDYDSIKHLWDQLTVVVYVVKTR